MHEVGGGGDQAALLWPVVLLRGEAEGETQLCNSQRIDQPVKSAASSQFTLLNWPIREALPGHVTGCRVQQESVLLLPGREDGRLTLNPQKRVFDLQTSSPSRLPPGIRPHHLTQTSDF